MPRIRRRFLFDPADVGVDHCTNLGGRDRSCAEPSRHPKRITGTVERNFSIFGNFSRICDVFRSATSAQLRGESQAECVPNATWVGGTYPSGFQMKEKTTDGLSTDFQDLTAAGGGL